MESFKQVESRSSKRNKKPEFNSSRVSPIPNGNSQWGDFNGSKSFNPMFGSSKKFFSASVLGSRIVSWATSLISRRSSPPRSTTPTPTLGGLTSPKIVVDDAKRTNDSLSQEVTRLRQQVENLTLKAQLQEAELEAVKEVIKSLLVTAVQAKADKASQKQQPEMVAELKKVILVMTMNGLCKTSQVFISCLPPYLAVLKILSEYGSVGGGLVRNKRNNGGWRTRQEYTNSTTCARFDKSSVDVGSEDCGH